MNLAVGLPAHRGVRVVSDHARHSCRSGDVSHVGHRTDEQSILVNKSSMHFPAISNRSPKS